jgi:lambda family phage portal protein
MAILDQFGQPMATPHKRHWTNMLARYDAAQTVTDNERHWANADNLSADAANSLEVRRKLRSRSRYEVANNSYCRSMVDTVSADVIGTGPRLQLRTGDRGADRAIERQFARWARAIKLPKKMRTMKKARAVDGETFAMFVRNRRITATPIQLDLKVIECDRITDPTPGWDPDLLDGIRFDDEGNVSAYAVLEDHPGDQGIAGHFGMEHSWLPANRMIHLFRTDRSEQHRGIPETTPALPLFSQLRRYTLAVLAAAETAADHALVIQTAQMPEAGLSQTGTTETAGTPEAMDVFELTNRMVTVMPDGYQLGQLKPEQPTTTYGEFKREILAEAFAAFSMPFNVGAHDSSDFNFASGKLDRLGYARMARIDQTEWESDCLLPVFLVWASWATLVAGYLPIDGLAPMNQWEINWFWDGLDDIDPQKAASATATKLETFQTTLPQVWAEQGRDWEPEMENQAEAFGMTVQEYKKRLADKMLGPVAPVETAPAATQTKPKETADAQSTD